MGAGHSHGSGTPLYETDPVVHRRVTVILSAVLVPMFLLTVVLLVVLWPRADPSTYLPEGGRFAVPGVLELSAKVTEVRSYSCDDGAPGASAPTQGTCARAAVVLVEGPEQGKTIKRVELPPVAVSAGVEVGQHVRLLRLRPEGGEPAAYTFSDFSRGSQLLMLTVIFVVSVVAVARLRGLLGLVALGLSFIVLVQFLLPSLLMGANPLLVGSVAAAAIIFVVLYLAHGISIRTTTALIGTLFGLAVAAGLGAWAVSAAHLTGAASEESLFVRSLSGRIDLSGLLLAGIVIAGLGVLNDVTVTQAAAVWELHALEPSAGARRLFTGGMRIGRHHIASSVYTIAFAYAGSALPVMLLILLERRPLGMTLTSEAVAEEITSILIGGIALVLSVPLTTAVGVALVTAASRGSASSGAAGGHGGGHPAEDPADDHAGHHADPAMRVGGRRGRRRRT